MSNPREPLFSDDSFDGDTNNFISQELIKMKVRAFKKEYEALALRMHERVRGLAQQLESLSKKMDEVSFERNDNYAQLLKLRETIIRARNDIAGTGFKETIEQLIEDEKHEEARKQCEVIFKRDMDEYMGTISHMLQHISTVQQRLGEIPAADELDFDWLKHKKGSPLKSTATHALPKIDSDDSTEAFTPPPHLLNADDDWEDSLDDDNWLNSSEDLTPLPPMLHESDDENDLSFIDDQPIDVHTHELELDRPRDASKPLSEFKEESLYLSAFMKEADYLAKRSKRLLLEIDKPILARLLERATKKVDERLYDYHLALREALHNPELAHIHANLARRLSATRFALNALHAARENLIQLRNRKEGEELRAVYSSAQASARIFQSTQTATAVAEVIPDGVDEQELQQAIKQYIGIDANGQLDSSSSNELVLTANPEQPSTSADFTRRFIRNEVIIAPPKTRFSRTTPAVTQKVGIIEEVNNDSTFSKQTVMTNVSNLNNASDDALLKFASELVRTALASVPSGPIGINDKWPEKLAGAVIAYCHYKGMRCEGYTNSAYDKSAQKFSHSFPTYWQRMFPDDVGINDVKELENKTDSTLILRSHPAAVRA